MLSKNGSLLGEAGADGIPMFLAGRIFPSLFLQENKFFYPSAVDD
jgi:hypothetical protein